MECTSLGLMIVASTHYSLDWHSTEELRFANHVAILLLFSLLVELGELGGPGQAFALLEPALL